MSSSADGQIKAPLKPLTCLLLWTFLLWVSVVQAGVKTNAVNIQVLTSVGLRSGATSQILLETLVITAPCWVSQ